MGQAIATIIRSKRWLLSLGILLAFHPIFGQNISVSGTVSGEDGPLPGATVVVKGSDVGAIASETGTFQLTAPSDGILVVSYYGFQKQEVPINGRINLVIELTSEVSSLEEVVLVGYGTQKKKEITGAVVNVGEDLISQTATQDLGASLQGLVAGVNIQASSGRPGDAANVQIRGLGSINAGALGPLYVVDGIPYEGNPNIAPEQIKSVDILKDGAAASIYGTRASNGVILITTKRGTAGQMKVDFNAYAGVQNITSGTPLMNARQQMYAEEVKLEALGRDPLIFFFNQRALEYDSDFVADVQNDNALIQNYNLGISGGKDNLTFNVNTTYFNQDGVLVNSGFDRLTNRVTGEFKKGRFKAFTTISFTEEKRQQEPWALYEYSIAQMPWQPPLNGLTPVGQNSVEIPVRNAILYSFLSQQLDNIDERKTVSSNMAVNLQYEILKGLTFKVNLGRNSWEYQRKFFRPQYLVYNRDGSFNPTASREEALLNEDFTFSKRETFESVLTYNRRFGKHGLNLLGVVSYEQFDYKALGTGVIYSENGSNDLQTLGSGAEGIAPYSNDERRTLSGKLVRLQYNYDDRYLLSASYRRDGSSKFSEANRYGDFKGVSAGWNIHNENFFQLDWVNGLKIRASWAEVGNQNIASYAFDPVISTGINYPFGPNEALSFGSIQRSYVDPNIKWETTVSSNLGLDLVLWDNRLNFTADFYLNAKEDMLLQERLPASVGVYQPRAIGVYDVKVTNAGNMINRGMEFSLAYQNQTDGGFRYKIFGTFTRNINEVTDLNGIERGYANGRPVVSRGENTDYTTYLAEGYEAGAFFLVQHDGLIRTEEELAAYKAIDGGAQLGDLRYVDQNEDGLINDSDRVYMGSGQPDFEAGLGFNLEYKGFDLYVQTYSTYGAEIYNGAKLYAYTSGRHLDQYSMWTPQNVKSGIPTDRQNAFHNNVRARSNFFLEDGSYLRVRNLNLGYTIPALKTLGFERARVYFSALNPFTFTDYTGYDPEVGGDGIFLRGVDRGNYPVARQFIMGIQVGF
ncbi:MAG: TonB-dependent receptor [Bacteroidota bacterium]